MSERGCYQNSCPAQTHTAFPHGCSERWLVSIHRGAYLISKWTSGRMEKTKLNITKRGFDSFIPSLKNPSTTWILLCFFSSLLAPVGSLSNFQVAKMFTLNWISLFWCFLIVFFSHLLFWEDYWLFTEAHMTPSSPQWKIYHALWALYEGLPLPCWRVGSTPGTEFYL